MTDRQKPTDAEIKALKKEAETAGPGMWGYFEIEHGFFVSTVDPSIILALIAERERLREALKPFADEAEPYGPDGVYAKEPDDSTSVLFLRVGDLRRARAALEGR